MRKSAGKIAVTTGADSAEQRDATAEDETPAIEADAHEATDPAQRGDDAVRRLLRRAARGNRAALDRLAR